MTTPLNPALYEALRDIFGDVKIANAGEPRQIRYVADLSKPGRWQSRDEQSGEYYRVDCPYCSDRGRHLWINHEFGTRDPKTGYENLHLAICYRRNCLRDRARRQQLHYRLDPMVRQMVRRGHSRRTARRGAPQSTPVEHVLPENCTPLIDLPDNHHAIHYVQDRGYCPQQLWEQWEVYYSALSEAPRPGFCDRLVIPVYALKHCIADSGSGRLLIEERRELAGWQARALRPAPPDESVPKYLSAAGMQKSMLLYGLPHALETSGPLVIVEGVTDVWRLESHAVALFGKVCSRAQQNLLLRRFAHRPLVVFLDHEAETEARQLRQQLLAERSVRRDDAPVVLAELPEGATDVGECDRQLAWEQVARALEMPLSELVEQLESGAFR